MPCELSSCVNRIRKLSKRDQVGDNDLSRDRAQRLTSALSRSDKPRGLTVEDGRTQDLVGSGEIYKLVENPAAYFFEHNGGLKTTLLMLDGAMGDFNFAVRVRGMEEPQALQFFLTPTPNVTYST